MHFFTMSCLRVNAGECCSTDGPALQGLISCSASILLIYSVSREKRWKLFYFFLYPPSVKGWTAVLRGGQRRGRMRRGEFTDQSLPYKKRQMTDFDLRQKNM